MIKIGKKKKEGSWPSRKEEGANNRSTAKKEEDGVSKEEETPSEGKGHSCPRKRKGGGLGSSYLPL